MWTSLPGYLPNITPNFSARLQKITDLRKNNLQFVTGSGGPKFAGFDPEIIRPIGIIFRTVIEILCSKSHHLSVANAVNLAKEQGKVLRKFKKVYRSIDKRDINKRMKKLFEAQDSNWGVIRKLASEELLKLPVGNNLKQIWAEEMRQDLNPDVVKVAEKAFQAFRMQ